MNATDLKSLLYGYLATLRSPGGGERIGFEIEYHIKHLDTLEARHFGPVALRDLPIYRESAPRGGSDSLCSCSRHADVAFPAGGDCRRD